MSSSTILRNRQQQRMIDDVMTAYVKWREACLHVREAYADWQTAGRTEADGAYPLYAAALDREQLACDVYASLVTRLERVER